LAYREGGVVEARIPTRGHEGRITGTVALTTKDSLERTVVLTVEALVQREFVVDSPVVDFGRVPRGAQLQREVTVRVRSKDHTILSARSTDGSFGAYADVLPSGDAAVVVTTKPSKEPGLKFGTIRIGTSSPDMPELIVPVRAVITD